MDGFATALNFLGTSSTSVCMLQVNVMSGASGLPPCAGVTIHVTQRRYFGQHVIDLATQRCREHLPDLKRVAAQPLTDDKCFS